MQCRTILTQVLAASLGLAGWLSVTCLASGEIAIQAAQTQVGKYEKLEVAIETGQDYTRPFDPCAVAVDLLIESPSGRSLVQPAFFCQDYERQDFRQDGKTVAWYYPIGTGSWKARFAPTETGTHAIRARVKDQTGQRLSPSVQVTCRPSDRKGFLGTNPSDPRFLAFSEGQPFFAIGQNLAFVGETQYVNIPKAEEILARLAQNGANFLRLWTCCDDWAIAIESRKSAWTRSWRKASPVVALPGREDEPDARQCVELTGRDGASITVSPSHRVALKPGTRYLLAGRFMADGPTGLHLQVADQHCDLPSDSTPASGWQEFSNAFVTDEDERWLGRTSLSLIGAGTVWLDGLSLEEADGGAELLWEANVNRPVRGYYNQLDCFMLDQLIEAAEHNGIYMMLCLLTRDLYMSSLATVGSPEYRQAVDDAQKLMRYAVARWGYSTSVAAWEYFNEMDPGKPTDRFYADIGTYLGQIDINRHAKTTSTWHPSARDCRLTDLDIAQLHHYLRPGEADFKDEVQAIVAKTAFLRQHAPAKPALIGEFGLATEQWGLSDYMKQDDEGVHFHNCLWASAFAGASGTAMFWWWEHLDLHNAYRHYRPLSAYLSDVSLAGLRQATAESADQRLQILGYQGEDCTYLWLFNKNATWWNLVAENRPPDEVEAEIFAIEGLATGMYAIEWWDTHEGNTFRTDEVTSRQGVLDVTPPPFKRDVACKIRRR